MTVAELGARSVTTSLAPAGRTPIAWRPTPNGTTVLKLISGGVSELATRTASKWAAETRGGGLHE